MGTDIDVIDELETSVSHTIPLPLPGRYDMPVGDPRTQASNGTLSVSARKARVRVNGIHVSYHARWRCEMGGTGNVSILPV